MGIVKTAMMSGAAMYGVNKLAKGYGEHQSNNRQQEYPPRRDPYDQRDYHYRDDYPPRGGQYSQRRTYDDRNMDRQCDPQSYREFDGKQGPNQYGRSTSQPGRYDDRAYDRAYDRDMYNDRYQGEYAPPSYERYPSPRRQGYIEGEVGQGSSNGMEDMMGNLGGLAEQFGGGKRKSKGLAGSLLTGGMTGGLGKK